MEFNASRITMDKDPDVHVAYQRWLLFPSLPPHLDDIAIIYSKEDEDFVKNVFVPQLEKTKEDCHIGLHTTEDIWGKPRPKDISLKFYKSVIIVSSPYMHDIQKLSEENQWGWATWATVEQCHTSNSTIIILKEAIVLDTLNMFHKRLDKILHRFGLFQWTAGESVNGGLWRILSYHLDAPELFQGWMERIETAVGNCHDSLADLSNVMTCDKSTSEKLQEIYEKQSFSWMSGENLKVGQAIQELLGRLASAVGKADENFGGDVLGVGSYFDRTCVGTAPNEFDYIYVLTEMSKNISKVQQLHPAEYRLQHQPDTTTGTYPWLSNILVRERLYHLIDHVMTTIPLPRHLHHGGILSPCFSGIRKNGPAFTLLFAWTGDSHVERPLLISIDLTIAIRPAHLETFAEQETEVTQLANRLGANARKAYLIAHADRDDAWLMTSAAMEVDVMSNLSERCVRIVRQLKVLKQDFLTIRENNNSDSEEIRDSDSDTLGYGMIISRGGPGGAVDKIYLKPHRRKAKKIPRFSLSQIRVKLQSMTGKVGETNSDSASGDAPLDLKDILSCVTATRRCWFSRYGKKTAKRRETKSRQKSSTRRTDSEERFELPSPPEGVPSEFQAVATSIRSLCSAYLKNSTRPMEESTASSETEKSDLDYLSDLLSPEDCVAAFEDCKPAITLKSCVFKYVIIGALLSGRLPEYFTRQNATGKDDLEAVLWVLEEIQKSKELRHPLLGIPIRTYSLSYRGYVVAPRFLSKHIENRLSDVLYCFLDTLIQTLRKPKQESTVPPAAPENMGIRETPEHDDDKNKTQTDKKTSFDIVYLDMSESEDTNESEDTEESEGSDTSEGSDAREGPDSSACSEQRPDVSDSTDVQTTAHTNAILKTRERIVCCSCYRCSKCSVM